MPLKTFYLDKAQTAPIVISHGFNWKNLSITKDGEVIGEVAHVKELRAGRSFPLSGDQELRIQLKSKWGFIQELEILLNGSPIPGSGTEPQTKLRNTYNLLLFIAGFNIILGVVAELVQVEVLQTLGMGYGTIVVGLLFALCAYLMKFKLSLAALYGAIALLMLDIVLVLVFAGTSGSNPSTGIMMKGIFIMMLLNGAGALKKIRNENLVKQVESPA